MAVSRQKCGLYIVGDSKFLKEASPLVWKVSKYSVSVHVKGTKKELNTHQAIMVFS